MLRTIPTGLFRALPVSAVLAAGIALSTAAVRAESPAPSRPEPDNANIAACYSCGVHYDECVNAQRPLASCVREYVQCRMSLCEAETQAFERPDTGTLNQTPLQWQPAD